MSRSVPLAALLLPSLWLASTPCRADDPATPPAAAPAPAPAAAPARPFVAVTFDFTSAWPISNAFEMMARETTLLVQLQTTLTAAAPDKLDVLDPVSDGLDPRVAALQVIPADPRKVMTDLGAAAFVVAEGARVGDGVVFKLTAHFAAPNTPTSTVYAEATDTTWHKALERAAQRIAYVLASDGLSRSLAMHKAVVTRTPVPASELPAQTGSINVTVEAAIEKALDLEKKGAAAAELKRTWCDLVPLTKGSSYEARVTRQCRADTLWLEVLAARDQDRIDDYRLVKELVSLKRRPAAEKKQVLTEFVAAYRDTNAAEAREAEQALKLLERGVEPDLQDADKDGVLFDECADSAEDRDGTADDDGCPEDTEAEKQARAQAEVDRARQAELDRIAAEERARAEMFENLFALTIFDFDRVESGFYAQALTAVPPPTSLTVPIALGMRGAIGGFDVALGLTSTEHAPNTLDELLLHAAFGVYVFEAPTGTFTLLRPEVALEYFGNPLDDFAPFATTVTISNDLSVSLVHLRPFYRYAFWRSRFPQHQVGVELFLDFAELGLDDPCFGLCG